MTVLKQTQNPTPIVRPNHDHLADVRATDNRLAWLQRLLDLNDALRKVDRQ